MESNNEYYGIASTPTEDYLAHYGVRGMKWGVRRALASGNAKALGRQYKKAQKKLAKLEKHANEGAKYARRASRLGKGAAAAGAAAALGTSGVAKLYRGAGKGISNVAAIAGKKFGIDGLGTAANKINTAAVKGSNALVRWGGGNSVGKALGNATVGGADLAYKAGVRGVGQKALSAKGKLMGISNDTYARIGAGAIGAGLAAGAAYNMHRAKHTDKAAKKAAAFRAEMNKQFAGTKYANGGSTPKKRRHR